MSKNEALLIIAASDTDADLFYATGFLCPDPFTLILLRGRKYLLTSDLEIDRAKTEARVHQVISKNRLAKSYHQEYGKPPDTIALVAEFLKKHRVRRLTVPGNFPSKYLLPLRRKNFRIRIQKGPLFPERTVKTPAEIRAITKTLRQVESVMDEVLGILKKSTVRKGKLFYRGELLKSETVQKMINIALMKRGCLASRTIVSCGKQSINPHQTGSGPLYAHQPIIMDIFPRDEKSRYCADFSRTVVRGTASPKLKKMYAAVRTAQNIAFKMLREGVNGQDVHRQIHQYFKSQGFQTGLLNKRMQGFFHGTGHGIGLDIHEYPRIAHVQDHLKAGQIVTVEPGLYYEDTGGVRLEDLALITQKGCKNLTRFPKVLEI